MYTCRARHWQYAHAADMHAAANPSPAHDAGDIEQAETGADALIGWLVG